MLIIGIYSCSDNIGGTSYNNDGIGIENFGKSGNYNPENNQGKLNEFVENPFIHVKDAPISTFSVDADGGSYAHVRGIINSGETPYKYAIRVEEFLNYFPMDYRDNGQNSISLNGEVSECPWNKQHKLIRIGIKGRDLEKEDYPLANFVLLIDVSGSMKSKNKLNFIKQGFAKFVDQMRDKDRLAIVTYAGKSGVLLPSTPGFKKSYIKSQINKLGAGGSTAGAEGINTAYKIVEDNYIQDGNNRVILGTDGDFNVGISSQDELIKLIEEKRKSGSYLTTIGVGKYLNEAMLEQLANKGNGNYEYIDRVEEMEKVFINDYNKFLTVAKDVKVQITFNSEIVEKYRLIGYVNRLLEKEDFENDTVDAGEIGAGQTITALYEIIPNNILDQRALDAFSIDFRYKEFNEDISKKLHLDVINNTTKFENSSENMIFSAAVASFGMILFDSEYKGNTSISLIPIWVNNAMSYDPYGYRKDFLKLIEKVKWVK